MHIVVFGLQSLQQQVEAGQTQQKQQQQEQQQQQQVEKGAEAERLSVEMGRLQAENERLQLELGSRDAQVQALATELEAIKQQQACHTAIFTSHTSSHTCVPQI